MQRREPGLYRSKRLLLFKQEEMFAALVACVYCSRRCVMSRQAIRLLFAKNSWVYGFYGENGLMTKIKEDSRVFNKSRTIIQPIEVTDAKENKKERGLLLRDDAKNKKSPVKKVKE
jgi:hypothetical protein